MYISWDKVWAPMTAFVFEGASLGLIWLVLSTVAWWKIFNKAGYRDWTSLVPIFRTWRKFVIAWDAEHFWLMVRFCLISVAVTAVSMLIGGMAETVVAPLVVAAACLGSLVIAVTLLHRLSQAFGHGAGFTLGLLLLYPVFILILGLGNSEYRGRAPRYR